MRSLRDVITGRGQLNGGVRLQSLHIGGLGSEALVAVVENFPDPVMICGPAGQTYYANAAYFNLFDLPVDELPAPGIATLLRGDGERTESLFRLLKAVRDGVEAEEVLSIPVDHAPCLFDVRVTPLNSGQVASFWTLRARRQRIDAPVISSHTYKEHIFDIVENAPVGFAIVKRDGILSYVNNTLATWIGLDQKQILEDGLPVASVIEGMPGVWGSDTDHAVAAVHRAVIRNTVGMQIPVSLMYAAQNDKMDAEGEVHVVLSDLRSRNSVDLIGLGDIEARFLHLFDIAPVGIVIVDLEGKILDVNTAFRRRFYANIGRGDNFIKLVGQDYRNEVRRKIAEVFTRGFEDEPTDIQLGSGDAIRSVQLFLTPMREAGKASVVMYLVDITEQKNLELQFAQSQKMQAVGQLAGGIAHDFNNLLTAIIGYSDLLLGRHIAGDPSFSDIHQIKQNASRAANLVRQLLAFSRQQTLKPKIISLTDMLAELNNLLRRLLGDKIEMTMTHGRSLGMIKVDQGQLENVMINLAVNARDAMGPNGGTIRIRTENVSAGEARALDHAWMPSGDCVMIEVADSGPGIPKEIIGKIFEPFFTTKEVGKGTGLGLSTAYGIIKQQGGNIYVSSEPSKGAVFRIYLPRHDADDIDVQEAVIAEHEPTDLTGKGLILLVEDEEPVRAFAARALAGKGYTVLEASNGEMALDIMRAQAGRINLVISDVMMPNMDGATLLKEIRDIDPHVRAIFISGYAEDAFRNNEEPLGEFAFLPKPFTLRQLASRVKEIMGNN